MTAYRAHRRDDCRICGATALDDYLDLGDQPPSNAFLGPEDVADEQRFPLVVALCRRCGLSQLRDVVAAADIFDSYDYLSSSSGALVRHYEELVAEAVHRFAPAPGGLVADIGCNDGIMLRPFAQTGARVVGIEPSSAGEHAVAAGFDVVRSFFDRDAGRTLRDGHGAVSIVTTTNVYAHVDDIRSFTEGVAAWLAADGVWILEFPYLFDMLDRRLFDTVYHEHLSYLALSPLVRLFGETGLRAFDVSRQEVGASGPALRLFVCRDDAPHATTAAVAALLAAEATRGVTTPAPYRAFAAEVEGVRDRLRSLLGELWSAGSRVAGYCAPAKGNTLLNYIGLGPDDLVCVTENNPLKIGKLTPGSHIPIVADDALDPAEVPFAILLAWNYLDFFLERAPYIRAGGRFIVPLPEPHIRP